MNYDRDCVYVKGQPIRHSTAMRDWLCGTCGGNLTTHWFDEPPNWRTVCANDATHDPDKFVHQSTWAYLEARRKLDADRAHEIFGHLPPELQAAILANP